MDAIDRAISKQKHISSFSSINLQTWDQLNSISKFKKIVIFGVGVLTDLFWQRCVNHNNVIAIVDNNRDIWGLSTNEFSYYDTSCKNSEFIIESPDILKRINLDETIIVISSINFYDEIIRQLGIEKIDNYFVTLIMEATYTKEALIHKQYTTFDGINMYPISNRKIVFFSKLVYSGHSKYIIEELLKIRSDLDIVWMSDNINQPLPEGVRFVHSRNLYELSTAHILVGDYTYPLPQEKRDSQIYIQVKHWSSVTLKSFGLDLYSFRPEDNNDKTINDCIAEGKKMDYLIAGSQFDIDTCKKAFPFKGTSLLFGSPRSDILFKSENSRKELCSKYSIDITKKIIIYAPTFRCIYNKSKYYYPDFNLELDFSSTYNALIQKFGNDCYILLRLHPNVAEKSKGLHKPEYVIDVSEYPDSQKLVAACDIMITDYSSIMFEPAFVRKPVFLFAPDRKEYIDKERQLLIEYDSLPFSIAETNEELAKNIVEFDIEKYTNTIDAFFNKYGVHEDGHASERTAKFISEIIW